MSGNKKQNKAFAAGGIASVVIAAIAAFVQIFFGSFESRPNADEPVESFDFYGTGSAYQPSDLSGALTAADLDFLAMHTADISGLDIEGLVAIQKANCLADAMTPYVILNNGVPYFSDPILSYDGEFEAYSELDALGRCGMAIASVSRHTMPAPDETRGSISSVKPTGWVSARYDNIDNGGYLYNRCHLIGYQLCAENANKQNLITGTRYLNIDGMLSFENQVADYAKATGGHVIYAVTPVFYDNELVARGVLMEGYSLEDAGHSVKFCIFAFNSQPGIEIDYATGESRMTP